MNYYFYKGSILCEQNMNRAGIAAEDARLLTTDELDTYFYDVPDGYKLAGDCLDLVLIECAEDSICRVRPKKLAEMRSECGKHIDAGFDSDALGYECQYKNTRDRQKEISDAIKTKGGEIWRNEAYTLHTLSQARLVETESINELRRHKRRYDSKCVYINNPIRTTKEINAVTWDSVE